MTSPAGVPERAATDDWSAFAGHEHVFLGMNEPGAFLRSCVEGVLGQSAPGVTVDSIRALDRPKHLLAARPPAPGGSARILALAVAFPASLEVSQQGGSTRDRVECCVTVLLGDLDKPGRQRVARFLDIAGNGPAALEDNRFAARFAEFQREIGLDADGPPQSGQTTEAPVEAVNPAPGDQDVGGDSQGQKKSAGLPADGKASRPWWKFWKKG